MVAVFIRRDSYFCVGWLANMDKMLFSWDYHCYYYPRVLDREVCANSVDPDQMSHYALCVQGLHYFTLTQQCLDKSADSIMSLLKR